MRPTLLVLLACALLVAGCAAPQQSRDHPDNPQDATTGDGGGAEISGTVTVVPGNQTSNGTAANQSSNETERP